MSVRFTWTGFLLRYDHFPSHSICIKLRFNLQVQLDTGSSDLWLDPSNVTFPSTQTDTGVNGRVGYGYVK